MKDCLLVMLFFGMTSFLYAQTHTVKGLVSSDEGALPGVSVVEKGTSNGTTTNANGSYTISVSSSQAVLEFSFVGYNTQSVNVDGKSVLNVSMLVAVEQLSDVVLVGSRFVPRTVITSPVPIDNITIEELKFTGQTTVDQMLNYTVPSYNSSQQTISDATAHFDPADLRGLGPSRTLVLINGKRKNPSALVYINDTPGKGEVGVDMKSIPAAAIKRIEVLRDGASAQYGSDAIAGVINIILKDDYEYSEMNISSGITSEGDGFYMGYDLNTGVKLGDKGFLNLTAAYRDQKETNRAGTPHHDTLFVDLVGLTPEDDPFFASHPDLGMHVGMPNMTSKELFYNYSSGMHGNSELYSFGGMTFREGLSYALYRAPYWIPDEFGLLHDLGDEYEGFQPTFETSIFDLTFGVGVRGIMHGWNYDLSSSYGSNSVDYTIGNTLNLDLGADSPTNFEAGGYEFRHSTYNYDIGKSYGNLAVGFGTEYRVENFVANAGEEASYFGAGAQSFPGIQPQNAVDETRSNIGFYTDLGYDLTEDFFIGGAARYEDYSDFGNSFTWKLNGRYKMLDDKLSFRASAATGFRAPSLHQRFLSNIQTLVSGGSVSNQGTFNNESEVVQSLGVNTLKEENSMSYTFGVAARPCSGLELSFDVYNIKVDDRVVYSSSISSSDTTTALGQILNDYNVTSIKFFTNAIDTETKGMDFVASYSGIEIGPGELGVAVALNINETLITNIDTTIIDGVDIFDRKEQSRIETARPADKKMLKLTYKLNDWTFSLAKTRFGEVTWKHADNGLNGAPFGPDGAPLPIDDADYDQTFAAKIITDLNLNYRATDRITLNFAVNNLMDVYPDKIETKGDMLTNLGGRFDYPWEVNQFGFMGRTYSAKVSMTF